MMMTAPDETEARPEADPFRQAAWPLISLVLESSAEGSHRREMAMREIMRSVERVRSILSQRYWN